ncbi:MAG: S9 family peptidase [Phycisphaerae bacterium]|nr:S9 family peptidase [Phycisphaerae bacterium]
MLILATLLLALNPPTTDKKPVTDTYHGVAVTEDYRHLEDWSDPAVKAWSEAQNAYARSVLDKLPNVDPIRARVTEIMSAQSPMYFGLHAAAGKVLALKRQPPKQQPMLVIMDSAHQPQTERVLVDPAVIDPEGHTSIDWFVPSHTGKYVAVSLSKAGTESGDVHVFDIETGQPTGDVVPRVNGGTAGGSLAWSKKDIGFFYSRYPRAGERPEADMDFYTQVYYHKLGTPTEKDLYEIGGEKPQAYKHVIVNRPLPYGRTNPFEFTRIAEIWLQSDPESGRVLCTVQHGDGGTFALYLRDSSATWRYLADYDDKIVQAAFGPANTIYLISRDSAPKGKVMSLSIADDGDWTRIGVRAATLFIPEGRDAIVSEFWDGASLTSAPRALFVTYQLGGPSEIRAFDHHGNPAASPRQLKVAEAGGVTVLDDAKVLFSNVSYIDPAAWYEFDVSTGETRKTALEVKAPVSFDDCEVVREFATSKDGTKVPINIIRRKGLALDGSHPCLITGYGGYGVNITPSFRAANRILIEQGFVFAEVNLRGGGEYGEAWHRQGALTNKQNVFDDFAAACRHMIDAGYTRPERLVIEGGSNGGLLMGATLTQHPDLCRAVVSHVGIYDMLRVELSPNGAFNIPEFGTVKDEAQFRALHAYSPYHNVREGVTYPSVLFLTGANDPRVDPMQSRKMTARLQAVGADCLLRTSGNSGHGGGTPLSERIEQKVDAVAWIFDRLGLPYQPTK